MWGVDVADDLEAIGAELSTDRNVARAADGTLSAVDESGFALGFALTQPAEVAVAPPREVAVCCVNRPARIGRTASPPSGTAHEDRTGKQRGLDRRPGDSVFSVRVDRRSRIR